jgi:hypothetical protein
VIPPAIARRLGARPSATKFGRGRACTLGVQIGRRLAPATALIIPGAEPLLGVETLEALGLKVDPKRGKLEPTRTRTVMLVGVRPACR